MASSPHSTVADLMAHAEGARRLAQSLLRDPHRAEDVAQDALLIAVQKAPGKLINPRAWLYRVTRNQAWASARKQALRVRHERAAARREATSPDEYVDERAKMQKGLIEAVLRLPEPYRAAVWMRFFDEEPPRVIARELGLPVETVRTRVRRGLERLRADLDATHGGDRKQWRTALLPIAGSTSLLGGTLMSLKALSGGALVIAGALGLSLLASTAWLLTRDDTARGDPEPLLTSAPSGASDERPGVALAAGGRPGPATRTQASGFRPGAGFLSGTVTKPNGEPLSGVPIQLFWPKREGTSGRHLEVKLAPQHFGQPPLLVLVGQTVSDAHGRFHFDHLPHASYRVHATGAPPRCSTTAFVPVDDTTGRGLLLVLPLGVPLKVRVLDRHGVGVSALVTCTNHLDTQLAGYRPWSLCYAPTDREGRVVFLAPAGRVLLSLVVAGELTRTGIVAQVPRKDELVIELASPQNATLHGRITSNDGAPVAGARVAAVTGAGFGTSHQATTYRATTTDKEGRYRLEGLQPGKLVTFQVAAAGYVGVEDRTKAHVLASGRTIRIDLSLQHGVSVAGRILDPSGEPIADAEVTARTTRTTRATGQLVSTLRTQSGSDGHYRLEHLAPGPGLLYVQATGYYQPPNDDMKSTDSYDAATDGSSAPVDVILRRGVPVHGHVRDGSGAPVEGARVLLQARQYVGWTWARSPSKTVAHSDAAGRFQFAGLPPGEWNVTVSAGLRRSEPVLLDTGAEGPPPALELIVRQGATVSGRISTRPTLERLRVHVHGGEGYPHQTVSVSPAGTFQFVALRAGQVEIYAVDWNHGKASTSARIELTWGQVVEDVVLEAESFSRISGVVVDPEGDPIPDLQVTLNLDTPHSSSARMAETDDLGRFVFPSIKDTGYEYTFSIAGQQKPGTVRPGDTDVRVVHAGVTMLTFKGRVHLPDGSPAPAGAVQVEEIIPSSARNGESRSGHWAAVVDGEFSVNIRRQRADATFAAYVQEVRDAHGSLLKVAPMHISDVQSDAPIVFELEQGLKIGGLVVDAHGLPLADVELELTPAATKVRRHREQEVVTEEDGSFTFEGLGQGAHAIKVHADPPWIRKASVQVTAGDRSVRIVLEAGMTIRGRVVDAKRQPVEGVSIAFGKSPWVHSDADGSFELAGIPQKSVGPLRAFPPRDSTLLGANLNDVRAGQQDVVVVLPTGTWIEGTLTGMEAGATEHVTIQAASLLRGQQGAWGSLSDGATTFRIGPVAPGRYRLSASVGGPYVAPPPLEVAAPATDVRIRITRGHLLRGRLLGSQNPGALQIVFHTMTAQGPSGQSGGVTRSGEFLITLREDKAGMLYAYELGGELCALVRDARPSDSPITIRLKPGKTIEGRIVGYDAEGDTGHVHLISPSGLSLSTRVSPDGTFRIPRVPDGTYQVRGGANRKRLVPHHNVSAGTKNLVMRFE